MASKRFGHVSSTFQDQLCEAFEIVQSVASGKVCGFPFPQPCFKYPEKEIILTRGI